VKTHEQELYNHFLNVLKLPKDIAVHKTKMIIEMELNLDRMKDEMLARR